MGATETDLLEMLDHLDLLTDQGPSSGLAMHTSDRMAAVGLQSDDLAVEQGIAACRSWVTKGRREVSRSEIADEIARRNLHGGERRATLYVQAIERYRWPGTGTVTLDWVDLFDGDHPRVRRQLRDPSLWNARLWPELESAEQTIHKLGFDRVLVRGEMRLPAWFATGVAFRQVNRIRVACIQGSERWGSEVKPVEMKVDVGQPEDMGAGADLAVGLTVTRNLAHDVLAYVRGAGLPVGRLVHVAVPTPGPTAFTGAAEAMGWALAVREIVTAQARDVGARKVHLFMSGPAGAALFLGHVWNRVPTTQVYEDLNPGYAPAFLIRG